MSVFDEYIQQGEPGRRSKADAWLTAIGLQDVDGESVLYNPFENLKETLDYDFAEERKFDYASASTDEAIKHIASFVAGIWQIHPFGEGNTRTTAVFLIMYLRSFGFKINNELFSAHSWYFRNALVRANYSNRSKGFSPDLKNRYLHISYQSDKHNSPKGQIGTLNVTLEERAVLTCLSQNNRIMQKEIAQVIGKSERTVKRIMASLSEKGIIVRRNGKRNGYWDVLIG